MSTITVDQNVEREAKRQCVCAIADQLKKWSELNPDAREKFMIGQICNAFGWAPDMYVDQGFEQEQGTLG